METRWLDDTRRHKTARAGAPAPCCLRRNIFTALLSPSTVCMAETPSSGMYSLRWLPVCRRGRTVGKLQHRCPTESLSLFCRYLRYAVSSPITNRFFQCERRPVPFALRVVVPEDVGEAWPLAVTTTPSVGFACR